MENTGIVILAAGRSARLGSMKQLLPFQHKTLLQHVIDEAFVSGAEPIMVVTGAHAKEVSESIDNEQVNLVFNAQWEQGKGSGIVAGVQAIIASNKDIERIIIAVCDQPFVTAALFMQLSQTQKDSEKHIVASAYADTLGTPVLFTRKYFTHLLSFENEEGAKKLLMTYREDVASVDFPQGYIDIDTREDYEQFLNRMPFLFPKVGV